MTGALAKARIGDVVGRFPWGSNATFLVAVHSDDGEDSETTLGVYKPVRGERPLWDFQGGLDAREIAAYELALSLGWPQVPETVHVSDGPYGEGSLQQFVEVDSDEHYFTLLERDDLVDRFVEIAVFDLVVNNADRKAGHVLFGVDGGVWAIDHGLCFHSEPKLRTVIWEFGGVPLPATLLADLDRIAQEPPPAVTSLLLPNEVDALQGRAKAMRELGELPAVPEDERPYPWPLV
jgi:hypothetical protein